MNILLLTTKYEHKTTGISRTDTHVLKELQKHAEITLDYFQPIHIPRGIQNIVQKMFKKDLQGFFNNIPFKLPNQKFHTYDIVYVMNQQNTFGLNWIKHTKMIVSVRDVMKCAYPTIFL
jgi:hypothetical protein